MLSNKGKGKGTKTAVEFEDGHVGYVLHIVDLGQQTQTDATTGEPKDPKYELAITFEIPEVLIGEGEDAKPAWITKRLAFPPAWPEKTGLHVKSNMYKYFSILAPSDLMQANSYPDYYFINDEAFSNSVGNAVWLEMGVTKGGNNKVVSIGKVPRLIQSSNLPQIQGTPKFYDMGNMDVDTWAELPEWIRKVISSGTDSAYVEVAAKMDAELAAKRAAEAEAAQSESSSESPDEEEDWDDVPY